MKHGLDFADLDADFFLKARVREARSGRFQAIGVLDGVVSVIFARLGREGLSVISMRRASPRERRCL